MSTSLEEAIVYGGKNDLPETKPFQPNFPKNSKELNEVLDNASPAIKKKMEEVKQLVHTFHEKVANYPKHMSYEGSMVLCVLLSMKKVAAVSMRNVPSIDQALIRSLLPKNADVSSFDVKFDDNKDFILIFNPTDNSDLTLTLFNTVAHPRPEDLIVNADVKVESQGDDIAVGGGKIKMNRKTIQRLFGHESERSVEKEESSFQQKQVNSVNKNAYEIRADVLQMAITWASLEDGDKYKKPTDEQLLSLAKKFYSFVENRR